MNIRVAIALLLLAPVVYFYWPKKTEVYSHQTHKTKTSSDISSEQLTDNSQAVSNAAFLSNDNQEKASFKKSFKDQEHTAKTVMHLINDALSKNDYQALDLFLEPEKDCSWCSEVYSRLQSDINSEATPKLQKRFYLQILAMSGRVDNLKFIVDSVKENVTNPEVDLFTEALELSVGKEELADYLITELETRDETLHQSIVAALTNHGSIKVASALYQESVNYGQPDGWYYQGIGLGEMIPDDETLGFLQEKVMIGDQYSHLAVNAILNNTENGLAAAVDAVSQIKDPKIQSDALKNAVDHVAFNEQNLQKLNELQAADHPPAVESFLAAVKESFSSLPEANL